MGLVCATDLLRHLIDPHLKEGHEEEIFETLLEEIMTTSIVCIEPDTAISEAASTMAWKRCGALPVTDVAGAQCRYGRLVGIVTERDILNEVAHSYFKTPKT